MRQKDLISLAMKKDLSAGDLDAILHRVKNQQEKKGGYRMHFNKVWIAAAIFCVMTVSVSAAIVLSGFGSVFNVPIDTGKVEILDTVSTNKDVTWNITEVWFDENNLHIGGSVTTPDVLATDGKYLAICSIKEPGDSEHRGITVHLFPNGEKTVPFIVSGFQYRDNSGSWIRHGYPGDTVTLELSFGWLQDLTDMPSDYVGSAEDFVIYPGTWTYTAKLTSNDETGIYLSETIDGVNCDGEAFQVNSVSVNPFTLEITGDNLMYTHEASYYNKQEDKYYPEIRDTEYAVFIRMQDGTLLGKESGIFAHTENRIEHRNCSENHMLFCFDKPIDHEQIVSILFVQEWATFPKNAEAFLGENGWDYYVSPEDEERLEGWKTVLEIPMN